MKKLYIAVIMLVLLIVFLLVKTNRDKYFNTMFNNYEAGEFDTEEGAELMKSFVRHLVINPNMSTEEILNLSKQFKVYEWDDFRIIEYIENPEHYGNSSKASYHIAIHEGKVKLIDINGSTRINGFIELDNKNYHMFVTDYKLSNMTGIDIYGVTINEKTIDYKSIVNKENLPHGFKSIDSLYYDNGHIYYKGIKDENEILINANETIFTLQFKEDGLYHILKPSP